MDLMTVRNSQLLVETGVARAGLRNSKSDGASTVVFAHWAKCNNAKLTSIDISADSIKQAKASIIEEGLESVVAFMQADSLKCLAEIDTPVDFLYLDSFDYDRHDLAIQEASQKHHLMEFQAIEAQLHEKSIVLIDDCRLPGGGKGKLLIEYMLINGWKIDTNAYQVLLVRE